MGQKQCTACAGTGREVIAVGSSFDRGGLCTKCGGTGNTW